MSIKVVINNCYGGFGLSEKAIALVQDQIGDEFDPYDHPRHCPVLVSVVEELGEEANGRCAELFVAKLKGSQYIVREYDGCEWLQEPDDIKWINALQEVR